MKEEIQKFFKGDVENSSDTLDKYSRDASIFVVRPKLVLFPRDNEDVKNLVKWVNQNKEKYPNLAITPRAAGTDMSGGALGESLILDFTRYMNKLKRFNTTKQEITVEPGMYYRDFEELTLERGLILPTYTASKSLNAMGGMYGNNSAGERTLRYGQTANFIKSAKVVFSNGGEYELEKLNRFELDEKKQLNNFEGELYKKVYSLLETNKEDIKSAKPKVSKNSSGYALWDALDEDGNFDLNRILVGSQGTLGITTEITFKLVKEKKYSKLVAVFLNDLEPLGRLVDEILLSKPETLETYDDKTMKLAVKFWPDFLKNKGFLGTLKFAWSFFPEFRMMLTGGFPKLVMLVEFSGENEIEVNKKAEAMVKSIKNFKLKTHITKSEAESNKYWDIRRESFALLRKHVKGKHTAPFIDDIIVRPEFLPKFLPELQALIKKYPNIISTLAGHAGDGNFHIIPLMDFKRPDTAETIMNLGEEVYELVKKYHGSITAEHNDGLVRTPYLDKVYSFKILNLFKEIKEIFDPQYIFNPGKKVPHPKLGGTKEYMKYHIAKEHEAGHNS